MHNISQFSIVFYPKPVTWGNTVHNLIDGILYIPHLQKTYKVTNPQNGEAKLDETPPTAKDYLLTAFKIGLFVLAGIKAFPFLTAPVVIATLTFVATLTVIYKMCHRFVTPNDTKQKKEKPIEKENSTSVSIRKKIIDETEEKPFIVAKCLNFFRDSFEVSKKREIPIHPKAYITQAFQLFTKKLAVTNFEVTVKAFLKITLNKESILKSALGCIGNEKSRNAVSMQFDIELGTCFNAFFNDFEKTPTLELVITAFQFHKNIPSFEVDESLKMILLGELPNKESCLKASHSLITSSWDAEDVKGVFDLISQCYSKEDCDEWLDKLLSELLEKSDLSAEQLSEWEPLITDKYKSQFVLLNAFSLINICCKNRINHNNLDEIKKNFQNLKKLLPKKINEQDKESTALTNLKKNFKTIVEHMEWVLIHNTHFYTDSLYIAYNAVAKILDFPEKALIINQRKIDLQNKVRDGTASENEQIEFVELISLEDN
jgi:hypothetical protein